MKLRAAQEWDTKFDEIRQHLIKRGVPAREAWVRARKLAKNRHGARPGDVPVKARLALWWLRRKLEDVKPMEVPMFWKKLAVSAVYGVGACGAVLTAALADNVISGNEWGLIAGAFITAFWGTFKSNTTVIAPSRKGETITGLES